MATAFERPAARRDWRAAGENAGQAVLELAWLNVPGAFAALRGALGAGSLEDQTTGQRAWSWLHVTVGAAVARVLREGALATPLDGAEARAATGRFMAAVLELEEHALDAAGLMDPAGIDALKPAFERFPAFLQAVAPDHALTEVQARARLAAALRIEGARVYAEGVADYRVLEDALSGPPARGLRRHLAWARHADWMRGLYEREPVFGTEPEDGVPLARTYIHLRCWWHETPERAAPRAHVGDLHETVQAWLAAPGRRRLRLITGGPGSGKSSFARAFAAQVLGAATHRVIFIPLQHMTLGGDLFERIGTELRKVWHRTQEDGGRGFEENPLEWMGEVDEPLLLIFDGLDELTPSEERGADLTKRFVGAVERLLAGQPSWRALVLGRTTACQAAMATLDLDVETLVHVAPLTAIPRDMLTLDGKHTSIIDHGNHLGRDQREDYWHRWCKARMRDAEPVPEAITHGSMGALNAEPLLLHLLIWSDYAEGRWEEARENRNAVYEAIFAKIFRRNRDKGHPAAQGIDEEDFFDLMECFGLAAWRGNGRTGDDKDFNALRGLHLPHKKRKLGKKDAASLKSIAVNFYTRLGEDAGFEFIHKSFGEYLAARALISMARRFAARLGEDGADDPAEVAPDWATLIGGAEVTEPVIQFAQDEARLMDVPAAQTAKDDLTPLLNWTLAEGMPVHHGAGEGVSYRTLETRQRCAETALLVALTSLSRVLPVAEDGGHRVATVWPDDMAARRWLERLGVTSEYPARRALARLHLNKATLKGLYLLRADLRGADLTEADLRGADLTEADLREANLREADLRGADLTEADLREANLWKADLRGANLWKADLRGADLWKADLREANLMKADLWKADLSEAHLRGADLWKADLWEADCNRMRIDSARLQSADFTGARNLVQSQIDAAAEGNADTKLPPGLHHPAHWLTDD